MKLFQSTCIPIRAIFERSILSCLGVGFTFGNCHTSSSPDFFPFISGFIIPGAIPPFPLFLLQGRTFSTSLRSPHRLLLPAKYLATSLYFIPLTIIGDLSTWFSTALPVLVSFMAGNNPTTSLATMMSFCLPSLLVTTSLALRFLGLSVL